MRNYIRCDVRWCVAVLLGDMCERGGVADPRGERIHGYTDTQRTAIGMVAQTTTPWADHAEYKLRTTENHLLFGPLAGVARSWAPRGRWSFGIFVPRERA